tara:strand:- start:2623 stop:3033 length:411 start_codon:yes stop_codon:yes gene_type:complete
MNLEWSAITLASHASLVLATMFAFINAIAVRRFWVAQPSLAIFERLEGPIFAIAAALIVERSYYVCARLFVNTGFNLWEAHPAPEVLAFMLASSMFWLATSIRTMGEVGAFRVRRVLMLQSITMAALFASLAWGLW